MKCATMQPPPGASSAKSVSFLLASLALAFAAAAAGALFPPGPWYASLAKPAWNPPNWIFGPVWTALYLLMAVAAWVVWKQGGLGRQRKPLTLYLAQLGLNAAWSPLFFGLHSPALALVDLCLLWLCLAATLLAFWHVSALAGAMLLPYLGWVTFAAVLNFALWRLNG